MRPSGDEEYQRFLGFPASMWPSRRAGRHDDEEERTSSLAVLRHPMVWVRWRMAVHRHGPYAPDFQEFRHQGDPDG